MRLNLFLLLVATGFINLSLAQISEVPAPPPANDSISLSYYPYYSNKQQLWGYANSKGKVLIKPAFKEIEGFFKGIAVAKSEKAWGIIDRKGKWIVNPEYDQIILDSYFGTIDLKKGEQHTTRYMVDGKIVDEDPGTGGGDVVFEEVVGEGWNAEQPTSEFRRFFHEPANDWRWGEFKLRPGKPDTLVYSRSFDFTIDEPIKTYDKWVFAITRFPDKKVGLMAWQKHVLQIELTREKYDSIWPCTYSNPTFYGKRDGKVALINFETYSTFHFYESAAQFDEIKPWSTVYYVVRMGKDWYRVKDFGHWTRERGGVSTTVEPELLVKNADDISRDHNSAYYFYKRNGLTGVVFNKNTVESWQDQEGKDDWFVIDAKFKDVKVHDYWFMSTMKTRYMFDVVMPDGKKGPMTSEGVLLFK